MQTPAVASHTSPEYILEFVASKLESRKGIWVIFQESASRTPGDNRYAAEETLYDYEASIWEQGMEYIVPQTPEVFLHQVGKIHELTATAEQIHLGRVNKYRLKFQPKPWTVWIKIIRKSEEGISPTICL